MGVCCGKTYNTQTKEYERKDYESGLSWLETPSTSSGSDKQNTQYEIPDNAVVPKCSFSKLSPNSSHSSASSIVLNIKSSSSDSSNAEVHIVDATIENVPSVFSVESKSAKYENELNDDRFYIVDALVDERASSTTSLKRRQSDASLLLQFKPLQSSFTSTTSFGNFDIESAVERITNLDSVRSFFKSDLFASLSIFSDIQEDKEDLPLKLSDITLTNSDSEENVIGNLDEIISSIQCETKVELSDDNQSILSRESSESSRSYFNLSKDVNDTILRYEADTAFWREHRSEFVTYIESDDNESTSTTTNTKPVNPVNCYKNVLRYLQGCGIDIDKYPGFIKEGLNKENDNAAKESYVQISDASEKREKTSGDSVPKGHENTFEQSITNIDKTDVYRIEDWLTDVRDSREALGPKIMSYFSPDDDFFGTNYKMKHRTHLRSKNTLSFEMREPVDDIFNSEQSMSYLTLDDNFPSCAFDLQDRIEEIRSPVPVVHSTSSSSSSELERIASFDEDEQSTECCYDIQDDMGWQSHASVSISSPGSYRDPDPMEAKHSSEEIIRLGRSLSDLEAHFSHVDEGKPYSAAFRERYFSTPSNVTDNTESTTW